LLAKAVLEGLKSLSYCSKFLPQRGPSRHGIGRI